MKYTSTTSINLIYIFRAVNNPAMSGYLKIGQTTAPDDLTLQPDSDALNAQAHKRIRQIVSTAGLEYELLHTELAAFLSDGHFTCFQDHEVHAVLTRSDIKRKKFSFNTQSEWFACDLSTALAAIAAVKAGRTSLLPDQISTSRTPVTLRPEQHRAVEQTLQVLRNGNEMLWYAKMRMGKTLTALQVVRRMKFRRTLILTHRPVVDEGWFEDFHKIFYETDTPYRYGSRRRGESFSALESSGCPYVYFASLQDLRGSAEVGGSFAKNQALFNADWDFLIIDEAHEGTLTELGHKVIDALSTPKLKKLHLSGTPFNLLDNFDDRNVFTWDYVMEQQAKEAWDAEHPLDPNPYACMPKLHMLTFDLGELRSDAAFVDDDRSFNFREFFRTQPGTDVPTFVHADDVLRFLDLISDDSPDTLYPFSCPANREYFRHTLWIVPGVQEGRALKRCLETHRFFGNYSVVNVAGDDDSSTPLDDVHRAIGQHPEDTFTITLSCGKLTTGVTVPAWTAVLYLAGSSATSPASYMQTIFRVQSPAVIGGRQKTACYVFDFASDRTLKIVADTVRVHTRAGATTQADKQALASFLKYCSVIAIRGTRMERYDVSHMMQSLKRVYVDRVVNSGFDDGHLYSNTLFSLSDSELERFADLRGLIGSTRAAPRTQEIPINNQGFDGKEVEKVRRDHARKTGLDLSPEEAEALLRERQRRRQRDAAVSILRGISIRMPLLIFGADLPDEDHALTLNEFVSLVDDRSWAEFMPQGVDKAVFAQYKQYYDEDIFASAARQIRRLAFDADRCPVLERVRRIAGIFAAFRNPDKETVLTPWRVVNMHLSHTLGGYNFFTDDFAAPLPDDRLPPMVDRGTVTSRVFEDPLSRVLEINSKSGLYPLYMAYSLFRSRLKTRMQIRASRTLLDAAPLPVEEEQQLWREVLRDNIFVICRTPLARSITLRTLRGFTDAEVHVAVVPDLLERISSDASSFLSSLFSGQIFPSISSPMQFNAIVGNPPYQSMGGSGGNNDAPVYQHFANLASRLQPQYISLILPARWFSAGRENLLGEFRERMLQCRKIQRLIAYADGSVIFNNVEIKGGICYYLESSTYQGDCEYTLCNHNGLQTISVDLSQFDIFIREPRLIGIVQKVSEAYKTSSVESLISSDTPFGIPSNPRTSSKTPFPVYSSQSSSHDVLLYHIENQKRLIEYVSLNDITKNTRDIERHKVFIPISGGSGNDGKVLGTPEIAPPHSVCSQSFIYAPFDTAVEAQHFLQYTRCKFFRILVSVMKITQAAPKKVYRFVPLQDFTATSSIDWSLPVAELDAFFYRLYHLSPDEVAFIDRTIKPM